MSVPQGNLKALIYTSLLPSVAASHLTKHTSHISLTIGTFLAWVSAISYLLSRLPQIYRNHTRRSTEGISISLFVATFSGNFCYASAILLSRDAWPVDGPTAESRRYLMKALPFLLGSIGTICFDVILILQCKVFTGY